MDAGFHREACLAEEAEMLDMAKRISESRGRPTQPPVAAEPPTSSFDHFSNPSAYQSQWDAIYQDQLDDLVEDQALLDVPGPQAGSAAVAEATPGLGETHSDAGSTDAAAHVPLNGLVHPDGGAALPEVGMPLGGLPGLGGQLPSTAPQMTPHSAAGRNLPSAVAPAAAMAPQGVASWNMMPQPTAFVNPQSMPDFSAMSQPFAPMAPPTIPQPAFAMAPHPMPGLGTFPPAVNFTEPQTTSGSAAFPQTVPHMALQGAPGWNLASEAAVPAMAPRSMDWWNTIPQPAFTAPQGMPDLNTSSTPFAPGPPRGIPELISVPQSAAATLSPRQPSSPLDEEASLRGLCHYSTFQLPVPAKPGGMLGRIDDMHVRRLLPLADVQPYPIILVHGDFHTGQVWIKKPDFGDGWSTYFTDKGFTVYVVDLPARGTPSEEDRTAFLEPPARLDVKRVQTELTASEKNPAFMHLRSVLHNRWPGTGLQGDPIFENYYAGLVPLQMRKEYRQSMAQDALFALLKHINRPAVLIGQGAGGTACWLAADAAPELVCCVVALEPSGPPGGTAEVGRGGAASSLARTRRDAQTRAYGLADIPLTYEPPVEVARPDANGNIKPPLDLSLYVVDSRDNRKGANSYWLLQRGDESENRVELDDDGNPIPREAARKGTIRQLAKLKQVEHHMVLTSDTSRHSVFDGATVHFMEQAGVRTCWIRLGGKMDIKGNGHLMFLEENSDQIAELAFWFIESRLPGVRINMPGGLGKRFGFKVPHEEESGMEGRCVDGVWGQPDMACGVAF
ncbi:hypothetical protein UVI_02017860 [Ustilaginoidea virens]|uniref:AB hydrolase-1 domain-containing protein n=1 Tax=Ustilaginoidea virens TaxID=1159556 RepID=A0A1B5KS57_USTVR|nr:hypothetical protein UVI_02017860 [Ustilaginoidea virens]